MDHEFEPGELAEKLKKEIREAEVINRAREDKKNV